jgi:hypothetical protein
MFTTAAPSSAICAVLTEPTPTSSAVVGTMPGFQFSAVNQLEGASETHVLLGIGELVLQNSLCYFGWSSAVREHESEVCVVIIFNYD